MTESENTVRVFQRITHVEGRRFEVAFSAVEECGLDHLSLHTSLRSTGCRVCRVNVHTPQPEDDPFWQINDQVERLLPARDR